MVVMREKSSMFWKVRAIPCWAIRWGLRPVISSPLKRICPAVGRYSPLMQLKIVVLPAPLGPMMEKIAAALDPEA